MKTLNEVQEFLNEIPCINRGGCGISTLSIYRWLKKQHLINNKKTKFTFCYMHYHKDIYDNNKKVIKKGKVKGQIIIPDHIILYFNKRYIDSDGIVNIKEYDYIQHINKEKILVKTNNTDGWNPSFNRNNISKIQKSLKVNLSDIKNFK